MSAFKRGGSGCSTNSTPWVLSLDLSYSLFLGLPATIGVHAYRLVGESSHGPEHFFVFAIAHLDFQKRIGLSCDHALFHDLR